VGRILGLRLADVGAQVKKHRKKASLTKRTQNAYHEHATPITPDKVIGVSRMQALFATAHRYSDQGQQAME